MLAMVPLMGFTWEFLAGGWALKPAVGQHSVVGDSLNMKSIVPEDLHSLLAVSESPESLYESDDSISEFEKNLRELLPDLHGGFDSNAAELPRSARQSERQKKPFSRFNEEAGYIAEPPKSTKKKGIRSDNGEGTTSKPHLITDLNNVQLANYCDACGISFTESANDCLNHIRKLELSRIAPVSEMVSSFGGSAN